MLNLQEFMYGTKSKVASDDSNDEDDGAESSDDDAFFKLKKSSRETAPTTKNVLPSSSLGEEDSSRMVPGEQETLDMHAWLEEGGDTLIESLRDEFVTGKWDKESGDDDSDIGAFKDLETGGQWQSTSSATT